MPVTVPPAGLADLLLREHVRFTGDGLPGEPLNAPLPIGDPRTGTNTPFMKMWRDVYNGAYALYQAAAEAAEIAMGGLGDAVAQGNVPIYSSRAAVLTLNINPGHQVIRTNGWDAIGDGGGAMYQRAISAPAHGIYETSADGAIWVLVRSTILDARALGMSPAASAAQNTAGFHAAIKLMHLWGGGVVQLPPGVCPVSQSHFEDADAVHNVVIRGAGRHATTILRTGGPTTGSYAYFRGCSGVAVEDLTLDAGQDVGFPDGAHCLHFDTCTNFRAERVHLRNFDASALSIGNGAAPTAYGNSDFVIRDVSIDGFGVGRNGILVNNAVDGIISGITGGNLDLSGETGSPSVGIGIKTYCTRILINNVNMDGLRRGCNLGAEGGVSQCRAWGLRFSNTIAAIGSIMADDCHFTDVTCRTPATEPDPVGNAGFLGAQIAMRDAARCTATDIDIRGGSNAWPLIVNQRTNNCYIRVTVWDNSPNDAVLLRTTQDVTGLRLDIDQYQGIGSVNLDPTTLLDLSAETIGLRFFWRGDKVLPA